MNVLLRHITTLYSKFLQFYPRGFQEEFAEEMQVVFMDTVNDASKNGILPLLLVCLRELGGLPINILQEFWHEFKRKDTIMVTNEKMELTSTLSVKASHWEAFLSALPFALFGVVSMISKIRVPWVGINAHLIFYCFVLLGLLIGLVKAFPRWAYSYLGWSLVLAWSSSGVGTPGLKIFGFQIDYWTWQIWPPFLLTIGIALIWTRSLHPLRQLVLGIWQDWTLLSLAMYSFVGFMMLLYDEVRAPYTIAFMIASTLVICTSVWIFMRNTNRAHRFITLLAGFFAGLIIDRICAATWDFNAYHGLPAPPPTPWYGTLLEIIFFTVLWSPIIWLPVLVGLIKSTINNEPRV